MALSLFKNSEHFYEHFVMLQIIQKLHKNDDYFCTLSDKL